MTFEAFFFLQINPYFLLHQPSKQLFINLHHFLSINNVPINIMREKYYFSMFNFGDGDGNLKKLREKKLALVDGFLAFN
jgi:hypothetical protein